MAPNPTGFAEDQGSSGGGGGAVTPGAGWDASGLAKEAGGVLATIAGRLLSAGAATVANILASLDSKITACNTAAIAGAVTANAGTNLNTSALALETGTHTLHGMHLGSGGQVIAIGAAAVRSAQLAVGTWRISGSGDIWFKQGDNAVVASAAAGSVYLASGAIETAVVVNSTTEGYISIIRDGTSTGNVSLTRML